MSYVWSTLLKRGLFRGLDRGPLSVLLRGILGVSPMTHIRISKLFKMRTVIYGSFAGPPADANPVCLG